MSPTKKKVIEKNWTHDSYQIRNSILYPISSSLTADNGATDRDGEHCCSCLACFICAHSHRAICLARLPEDRMVEVPKDRKHAL
jgi:hypothetical protein